MKPDTIQDPVFVIKAQELTAINFLPPDHARPRKVEWINRGTDQVLRPTTVDMLLRTLYQETATPSVRKLRDTSGLRLSFRTGAERSAFARAFARAHEKEKARSANLVTAMFDNKDAADRAVERLAEEGVPDSALSMLYKATQFMDTDWEWSEGHSPASVAGAVAGSGVAGALLGVAILIVPTIGPVAAAGAITASALSSVASVSAIIGATGGAIAKMLSDHDVDGVAAAEYGKQIGRGKVFLSVDLEQVDIPRGTLGAMLEDSGGRQVRIQSE